MFVASWNINSIRSRGEQLFQWLDEHDPDVLALQETRVSDQGFPYDAIRSRGYDAAHAPGLRGRAGVALIFKGQAHNVVRGVRGPEGEFSDRVVRATIQGLNLVNVYVPARRSSEKCELLNALRMDCLSRSFAEASLVLCGDFNTPRRALDGGASGGASDPAEHRAFRRLIDEVKLVDYVRSVHGRDAIDSWLDLEREAFAARSAAGIDYVLGTDDLVCEAAWLDASALACPKPADHAPVCVRLRR